SQGSVAAPSSCASSFRTRPGTGRSARARCNCRKPQAGSARRGPRQAGGKKMKFLATTRKKTQAVLLMLGLLALTPLPPDQNALEGFEVAQRACDIIIKVTLKDAPGGVPGSFTVANPARIAFDFPGTINALGRNSQTVGEGELRSMNVVQA